MTSQNIKDIEDAILEHGNDSFYINGNRYAKLQG